MTRRSSGGGRELLARTAHWETKNNTGAGWAAENNLKINGIEGKASCWLLAVLANIQGALDNRRHPRPRQLG